MVNKIVEMLKEVVEWNPRPAVFISGGLDSTILLHHLNEIKQVDEIRTYTVGIEEDNEFPYAEKVAEYYGTKHKNIVAKNILKEYLPIIGLMDRPRFNLWVKFAYKTAAEDGIRNVYIAEGLDEHFGGYEDRPPASPQETWAGVIEWSIPTHRQVANIYGIALHTPYIRLPLRETIKYWRSPHEVGISKRELRRAYKNIIPEFVLSRRKKAGRINWEIPSIWEREIQPYLKIDTPKTHTEANRLINKWITARWLEAQP